MEPEAMKYDCRYGLECSGFCDRNKDPKDSCVKNRRNTSRTQSLPEASADRKKVPLFSGVMAYFPDALVELARLSKVGNDKHNPGGPLSWSRGKSNDHADCLMRHLLDHGTMTMENGIEFSHTAMMAWRGLAMLQMEMEAAGAPIARGATNG